MALYRMGFISWGKKSPNSSIEWTSQPPWTIGSLIFDSTIISLQVSFFKTGVDIFGSIESIAPASAGAHRVSAITVAWLCGLNQHLLLLTSDHFFAVFVDTWWQVYPSWYRNAWNHLGGMSNCQITPTQSISWMNMDDISTSGTSRYI